MTADTDITASVDEVFHIGGDLPVRRIGLGAMRLSDGTGDGTHEGAHIWCASRDRSPAIALLRHAVDAGVQLIDTADAYGLGDNEELIAEALHPYPDDLVIATKVGNVRPSPDTWVPLGHPAYLRQQVELSLRRLRVERLDLLQLHRLDPAYSIADQVGTLSELRDEGKIAHLGLSEVSVEQLREARQVAPIAAVQNLYNLAERGHDPVVDEAAAAHIAFLPYFPLATGKLAHDGGVVAEVASELAATPSQVALAWLVRRSPAILPIPGTTSVTHLDQNLRALAVDMTAEQFARINGADQS